MYTFSAPPISAEIGGINAAIYCRKNHWNGFQKPLKVIPGEFFRPTSRFFYNISPVDREKPRCQSEEISLAVMKPVKTVIDIPIVVEDVTIRGISGAGVRSFMKTTDG